MTKTAILKRRLRALTAMAALGLAGCSGTNVGDSWQCPLAQGTNCGSVAAADPAVPGLAETAVPREPLYRARGAEDAAPDSARSHEVDCGGFGPFAWLARLFGAAGGHAGTPTPGEGQSANAARSSAPAPESAPQDGAGDSRADAARMPPAAVEAAALPADPAGGLRTGEVVARIWIAPFVDADGVYREASHVRAVLEPAGWRTP